MSGVIIESFTSGCVASSPVIGEGKWRPRGPKSVWARTSSRALVMLLPNGRGSPVSVGLEEKDLPSPDVHPLVVPARLATRKAVAVQTLILGRVQSV